MGVVAVIAANTLVWKSLADPIVNRLKGQLLICVAIIHGLKLNNDLKTLDRKRGCWRHPVSVYKVTIFLFQKRKNIRKIAIFWSAYPYAEQNIAIFWSAYPYAKQNIAIFWPAYPYAE